MRRRSDRLREKAEGLRADEEKVNRRQSAGSVLGLNAPAESKNLEDAQAHKHWTWQQQRQQPWITTTRRSMTMVTTLKARRTTD